MDWLMIGGIAVAGWSMLSVLSGERMRRSQQIIALRASAAAPKAGDEIPIAVSNEAALVGSAAAFNRKR